MARHLRPPAALVPAELLSFDSADWAEIGDEDLPSPWPNYHPWPAYWRWVAARKAWVESHPESHGLGSVLDRMKVEGWVFRSPEMWDVV